MAPWKQEEGPGESELTTPRTESHIGSERKAQG